MSVDTLRSKARAARREGRNQRATDCYSRLLELYPDNPRDWHNYAAALGDLGEAEKSADAAKRAQKLGLDAPETWLVLARAQIALGQLDDADASFTACLSRDPRNAAAHRDRAQLIWMRTGDASAAAAGLTEAVSAQVDNVELHIVAAGVLEQIGQITQARALADEAAKRAPNAPTAHACAAVMALANSDPHAALAAARRGLSLQPGEPAASDAALRSLLALGDSKAADQVATAMLKHRPDDQRLIALRATAWRMGDDPRYATLYDYTRYVRAYPIEAPPGWSSAEQYVDEVQAALSELHHFRAHPFDQSVKGRGSQLADVERQEAAALRAWPHAVTGAVKAHLDLCGVSAQDLSDKGLANRLRTWSVRLLPTGRHADHVHPEGRLSSACHLTAAHGTAPAGWLRFGRPGVTTPTELDAEWWVRPQQGVLVMFPSYMWHGVEPVAEGPERLTIAMDFVRE